MNQVSLAELDDDEKNDYSMKIHVPPFPEEGRLLESRYNEEFTRILGEERAPLWFSKLSQIQGFREFGVRDRTLLLRLESDGTLKVRQTTATRINDRDYNSYTTLTSVSSDEEFEEVPFHLRHIIEKATDLYPVFQSESNAPAEG
ncbi:MAG: hypothetical protein AAGA58_13070 [Verrucomicrobiota bacterium]